MTAPAAAGLPRRVLDTFIAPRRLARHVGRGAPWIGALALATAIALLAVLAVPDEVFLSLVDSPVDRRGRPVEITSAPATIALWGRLMAMLSRLALWPLLALGLAALLRLAAHHLARGRADYGRYLALTTHAMLIPALGTLLAMALQRIGLSASGAELSLQALAPALAEAGFLGRALALVDPFTLWALAVAGAGAAVLEGRHLGVRLTSVLLGTYLLLVLGMAAVG